MIVRLLKGIVAAVSVLILALSSRGQEPDMQSPIFQPRAPDVRFEYTASKNPLEMLQQTISANEALLAKQKESLSQLATLAEKAEANKAAAHRSTSRGGK
jgi:hypothetical protein